MGLKMSKENDLKSDYLKALAYLVKRKDGESMSLAGDARLDDEKENLEHYVRYLEQENEVLTKLLKAELRK